MYSVRLSRLLNSNISCGLNGPSETISPLSTFSPAKIFICLVLGIRVAKTFSFSSVITSLSLPFVGFPQETIPEAPASTADYLGFLASNKSATLGNPPVISFVLADS